MKPNGKSRPKRLSMKKSLSLIIFVALFASCANPHIGRQVKYSNPMVCNVRSLPAECKATTGAFSLEYTVIRNKPEEYNIQGKAIYTGMKTWASYDKGLWNLLLIQDGVVVEVKSFQVGSGALDTPIDFKHTFSTLKTFDAVILSYRILMTNAVAY